MRTVCLVVFLLCFSPVASESYWDSFVEGWKTLWNSTLEAFESIQNYSESVHLELNNATLATLNGLKVFGNWILESTTDQDGAIKEFLQTSLPSQNTTREIAEWLWESGKYIFNQVKDNPDCFGRCAMSMLDCGIYCENGKFLNCTKCFFTTFYASCRICFGSAQIQGADVKLIERGKPVDTMEIEEQEREMIDKSGKRLLTSTPGINYQLLFAGITAPSQNTRH